MWRISAERLGWAGRGTRGWEPCCRITTNRKAHGAEAPGGDGGWRSEDQVLHEVWGRRRGTGNLSSLWWWGLGSGGDVVALPQRERSQRKQEASGSRRVGFQVTAGQPGGEVHEVDLEA